MNRKASADSRDRPSIIEEIVIYDKPNKPSVPQDILQQAVFDNCKGDIVLSRTPNTSTSESTVRRSKEKRVKNEPSDLDEEVQEYESEEADEFDVNIKTENSLNDESRYEDDSSEVEESIENISKEISKSNLKSSTKASTESDSARKKLKSDLPFKKPRGRPRKQSTVLITESENTVEFILKDKQREQAAENGKSPETNRPSTRGVRLKRTRRRPKKYEDTEILEEDSEEDTSRGSDSEEDPSFTAPLKKKGLTELTFVPLSGKEVTFEKQSTTQAIDSDNLNILLSESLEEDVETQLQNLVEGGTSRQTISSPKKSIDRGTKKSSSGKTKKQGKQKAINTLDNNIKQEAEEENHDIVDVSREEAYGSDEDSRKEWVPEEYAEYKQQHILKLTSKLHKCKFCGCDFTSYYSMRKHRALQHDDVGKDRLESTYEAPQGAEEVEEIEGESDEESRGEWMPEDYAEYKLKHNMNKMKRVQWYKCKICCAVFSNYYKLSKHRVEHENKPEPYECKQCGAKFKDVDTLTAHIRTHQGKDPYKCKKCDKGFKIKEELISHMPVHILKKPPPPRKRFRCDLCGKEFSKLCDIERHTRVHTGEKPCECNICHKRFQQSHNLSKHLLTHLHVKPFQCEICNKKFGRIDVLNRHLLTHSMEKPYKCELCSKGFIRQVQLNNHTEKFHPEMEVLVRGGRVTDEVIVTPLG